MSANVYPYEGGRCPHGSATICPYCETRRFKIAYVQTQALLAHGEHYTEEEAARIIDEAPVTDLEMALGAFDRYVDTGDDCYLDNLNPEELRELAKQLGRQAREARTEEGRR